MDGWDILCFFRRLDLGIVMRGSDKAIGSIISIIKVFFVSKYLDQMPKVP